MGKPALRIGDLTAHGGTVTVGKPTVMIGKIPASTLGDMHVCPMTTGPVPHVGGPATLGSTGVMLSKMPGARVSDMHVCVGPPSMGAMGCMTVLLGEAGSGGDAGNAATAAAAGSASKKGPKAITPFSPIEPPSPATEIHWVEVEVVDSAGLPLGNIRYKLKDPNGADIVGSASPEGRIRHDGYAQAGSFKIEFPGVENAKWPSAKCKPNETLTLKADATGFTDGVPAMVVVFEERDNGRFQRQLARIPSKVSGGKVEASFTLLKEHYPLPFDPKKAEAFEESPEGKVEYFFFVEVEGLIGLSDKARFREDARIEVLGADGKPVGGKDYQIQLIDGTVRKGKLDKDGKATEKDIPVGPYSLKLIGVEAEPVDKKPDPGPGPDPVAGLVFPLPKRPKQGYHKGGLKFGALRKDRGAEKRRANGAQVPDWEINRAHGACDLVAPVDTPIFAMKDGKVVNGPYLFYNNGVQAIEVDHGDFLARYCEIKPLAKPVVKQGDTVKQGDVIAYVGKMNVDSMLHLEMYSGKGKGPLTIQPANIKESDPESVKKFRRRADLLDPTPWLDKAALKGEKPADAGAGTDDEEPVVADDDADEPVAADGDSDASDNSTTTETKELITKEALKAAEESLSDAKCDAVLPYLRKYSKLYGVDTPLKAAHFLAQVGHESGFKATEEKLSYSESRMKQIFGCKGGKWKDNDCPVDSRMRSKLWDDPGNHAHKPENLANYVYADRLGNGNEESGDGYKYRGRGIIQLTGKSNYKSYTDFHNDKNKDDKQDFVAHPEKVLETEYAVESAFAWWTWNKVNDLCVDDTEDTIKKVSLKVNGGTVGLAERTKAFKAIKKVLDSNV